MLTSFYCLMVQSIMVGTAWRQEASECDCRNMKLLAYIWTDQEIEMGREVGSDCEPYDPYSSTTLPLTVPCLLKDPQSPQTALPAATKSSKTGFCGGHFTPKRSFLPGTLQAHGHLMMQLCPVSFQKASCFHTDFKSPESQSGLGGSHL